MTTYLATGTRQGEEHITARKSSFCPLTDVEPGQSAQVVAVQGEPQLALRILEMGLVAGTTLRLLRAAPLGGPIVIEADGFQLSLRRSEADAITVQL